MLVAISLASIDVRSAHAQSADQAEYDVISAAIRVILEREPYAGAPASEANSEPISQVIILATPDPESPIYIRAVEPDSGSAMDPSTLSDYTAKAKRGTFDERFTGIGSYQLLPVSDLHTFDQRGGWPGFYERFPGAAGLFAFSRVGISADGREAIVHLLHLRHGDWGHSDSMLFRRQRDTWELAGEERLTDI